MSNSPTVGEMQEYFEDEDSRLIELISDMGALGIAMQSEKDNEVGRVIGEIRRAELALKKIREALEQRGHLYVETERIAILEAIKIIFVLDENQMPSRHERPVNENYL